MATNNTAIITVTVSNTKTNTVRIIKAIKTITPSTISTLNIPNIMAINTGQSITTINLITPIITSQGIQLITVLQGPSIIR